MGTIWDYSINLSILESNEIKDHGRLVTVGAVQDTDRYSTKGCRYGTIETWVRCGWYMVRYGRYMGTVRLVHGTVR